MKKIEIEEDIYDYLLKNTTNIGESASEILRRLLGISEKSGEKGESNEIRNSKMAQFLNTYNFMAKRKAREKFLEILSFIYQGDPEKFIKEVLPISVQSTTYFSLTKEGFKDWHKKVKAEQIPNSEIWVITNIDIPKKQRILKAVMTDLDYRNNVIEQAVDALALDQSTCPKQKA